MDTDWKEGHFELFHLLDLYHRVIKLPKNKKIIGIFLNRVGFYSFYATI